MTVPSHYLSFGYGFVGLVRFFVVAFVLVFFWFVVVLSLVLVFCWFGGGFGLLLFFS